MSTIKEAVKALLADAEETRVEKEIRLQKTSKEFVSALSNAVNSFGLKVFDIATEIKEASEEAGDPGFALMLARSWIQTWAKAPDAWIDGRNEAAKKRCSLAVSCMDENLLLAEIGEPYKTILDKVRCEMHKTLIQSTTQVMLAIWGQEFKDKAIHLGEVISLPAYWKLPLV